MYVLYSVTFTYVNTYKRQKDSQHLYIYTCVVNKNSLYKETGFNCISDTEKLNSLFV